MLVNPVAFYNWKYYYPPLYTGFREIYTGQTTRLSRTFFFKLFFIFRPLYKYENPSHYGGGVTGTVCFFFLCTIKKLFYLSFEILFARVYGFFVFVIFRLLFLLLLLLRENLFSYNCARAGCAFFVCRARFHRDNWRIPSEKSKYDSPYCWSN